MKQNILAIFAMAAVIGGTISCSHKDDGPATTGDNVLMLRLPDNVGPAERSVEAQVNAGVAITVSNAEVFFIDNNTGRVLHEESLSQADISAGFKRFEQVSSAVSKVVVVANIPTGDLAAVKALTTYPAIMKYPFTAASQNASPGVSDKTMMGEGTPGAGNDPAPDNDKYKAVTVALNALTARFEIGAVRAGTGIAQVSLVGVFINNFYTDASKSTVTLNDMNSPLWTTSPATTTSPSTSAFSTVNFSYAYVPPCYFTAGSGLVNLNATSQVYAFQVFAGNIPHVLLLVQGEYADDYYLDGKKYFLGWVTFKNYLDAATGTNITATVPNTIYKVGTGTTGILITADEGPFVKTDPEAENYDLGVRVTITAWTVSNVTPQVN